MFTYGVTHGVDPLGLARYIRLTVGNGGIFYIVCRDKLQYSLCVGRIPIRPFPFLLAIVVEGLSSKPNLLSYTID